MGATTYLSAKVPFIYISIKWNFGALRTFATTVHYASVIIIPPLLSPYCDTGEANRIGLNI